MATAGLDQGADEVQLSVETDLVVMKRESARESSRLRWTGRKGCSKSEAQSLWSEQSALMQTG